MNGETTNGEWKNVLLGEVCRVQGGFAFKSQDYVSEPDAVPLIRIGDLQGGQVNIGDNSAKVPVSFLNDEALCKYLLTDGDVLIAMTGATTGKLAHYRRFGSGHAFLNQRVGRIISRDDDVFLDFIFFAGQTTEFQQQISENILAAAQGNISPSKLESLRLVLPDIWEQRKIAAVLGLVQRAIEQQERLIVLTTELKKALLHKLFTEGLRGEPQKQTEIGPVPESWDMVELGKAANLFGGYAFRSDDSVPISNTQLVRMGNLYQNKLDLTRSPIFYPDDFAQQYARFVLKAGDLIMSLTGTSGKEDYGFTVELKPVPTTLLLNQRVARIDVTSEKIVKDFLFYFLLSRKFLDQLYQTAKGMKQANLSTHAMKQLKVPVPAMDEQNEIADYFRAVDRKNESHQRRADSLRDLFRTLLHQLITAQIRVNDLDLSELEATGTE